MRKNTYQKNKVILGFSGGVDSTVAALLLKNQGYNVIGYYFDVTGNNSLELKHAQKIAKELDIKLITEDVSDEFNEIVVTNFCNEYLSGRTPNPCIICNPNIKFKKLLDCADKENAEYIATGHYAQIKKDKDNYYIALSSNPTKDQTYMLYRLGKKFLSRLILPLGNFSNKEEIRKIARENNLSNYEQKDSQEICFVPDRKTYIDLLSERGYKPTPGYFINSQGERLGKHKGISNYTKGQRKGLGIALGEPVFVTKIDPEANTITLGKEAELMADTVAITNPFYIETESPKCPNKYINYSLKGKSRYASSMANCKIVQIIGDETIVKFETPQRSLTPGQSLVLYDDDKVIGGGFIK